MRTPGPTGRPGLGSPSSSRNFVRYELSLRDNVSAGSADLAGSAGSVGSVGSVGDEQVARALTDAGGAGLLADLAYGWDTVLSPTYTRGTDLSGGQWQRVALARALAALAGGAGLLVLDEPTAALDVRGEAALFDRFLDVTRGVTTLLVSHRLSSVRHAERIVVLAGDAGDVGGSPGGDPGGVAEGARIVEDGSHEELLATGGRYAEMFTLQASRFAAAGAMPR